MGSSANGLRSGRGMPRWLKPDVGLREEMSDFPEPAIRTDEREGGFLQGVGEPDLKRMSSVAVVSGNCFSSRANPEKLDRNVGDFHRLSNRIS